MKNTKKLTKAMVESSILVALATVLSMLKLVEMPYGGSVTLASMLPIVIASYRHGVGMGLISGAVYAAIQQLLGLNNLSYFTTWQSVLAVMLLDYIVAFTLVGLGGIARGKIIRGDIEASVKQRVELGTGMGIVCIIRYICHTLSGATVWAGLSIPTEAALVYSIGYNATYMIPETVVSVLAAIWIGELIDLSRDIPVRFVSKNTAPSAKHPVACQILPKIANLLIIGGAAFAAVYIAPYLQDAESGSFTFAYLGDMNLLLFFGILGACAASAIALYVTSGVMKKREA